MQIPPVVKVGDSKVTAETEQTIILSCRVSGLPAPVVSWSKSGNILVSTQSPEKGRFSLYSGNSLMIENIQLSDDGAYYCEAENEAGKDSQKVIFRNGFIFVHFSDFSCIVLIKFRDSNSFIPCYWSFEGISEY